MLKKDLLKKVAEQSGESQVAVDRVLSALQNVVVDELKEVGSSEIHGIARYKVKHRAARKGRNPQTGEAITIPARDAVVVVSGAISTKVFA